MFMQAVVIEVQWQRLLVLDLETRQNVLVNTPNARWFRPGDLVRIVYNGVMTNSLPPQIFALTITTIPQDNFPPVQPPPVVRPPCPPNLCPPVVFPPIFFPPVIRPPVIQPPVVRPPFGRPPNQNRPGRPR